VHDDGSAESFGFHLGARRTYVRPIFLLLVQSSTHNCYCPVSSDVLMFEDKGCEHDDPSVIKVMGRSQVCKLQLQRRANDTSSAHCAV